MQSFAWDGCCASAARPYSPPHSSYLWEPLAVRNFSTLFFRIKVLAVSEPATFGGLDIFFDSWVKAAWVPIGRSTVSQEKVGNRLSDCRNYRKRNVLGWFYGSLECADLRKKLQMTNKYGGRYMMIMAESFHRWTLELIIFVTDNQVQRHSLWAAAAPFGAVQNMDYSRCLLRDKESGKTRKLRPWATNEEFETGAPMSRANYRRQKKLQMNILRTLRAGEELRR